MSGEKTMIRTGDSAGESDYLPPDLYISVEVLEGPDKGMTASLTKTRTTMGRGADADIRFRDPTVSGTHAILEYLNGEIWVSDQRSSNGTFIDGAQTSRGVIGNMSELKLGDTKLLFSIVRDVYGTYMPPSSSQVIMPAMPTVDPNAQTAPQREVPNPALPGELRVFLYVVEGPDAGKKFLLRKQSTVLGRANTIDIQINDEAVSRQHCQVMVGSETNIGIKDLVSKNGTLINGKLINAVKVNPNDMIKIGDTTFRIIVMQ